MTAPPLLRQRCSPQDKDSLSPPWPSGLELGCYLMWLWLAQSASRQWAKHWVLMLFLLKENATLQGYVSFGIQVVCLEVFHCVSGSVADAQADLVMFPVGSQ